MKKKTVTKRPAAKKRGATAILPATQLSLEELRRIDREDLRKMENEEFLSLKRTPAEVRRLRETGYFAKKPAVRKGAAHKKTVAKKPSAVTKKTTVTAKYRDMAISRAKDALGSLKKWTTEITKRLDACKGSLDRDRIYDLEDSVFDYERWPTKHYRALTIAH